MRLDKGMPVIFCFSLWTASCALSDLVFLFLLKIFLMWTISKVFIEFVTILLLFYVSGFLNTRRMGS